MSEPDTNVVRATYATAATYRQSPDPDRVAEFDRWLAGVKADAWDEGEQAGMRRADWEYGATPNMPKPNPYEGDRHAGQ